MAIAIFPTRMMSGPRSHGKKSRSRLPGWLASPFRCGARDQETHSRTVIGASSGSGSSSRCLSPMSMTIYAISAFCRRGRMAGQSRRLKPAESAIVPCLRRNGRRRALGDSHLPVCGASTWGGNHARPCAGQRSMGRQPGKGKPRSWQQATPPPLSRGVGQKL
jgi:hypothetical protein